MNHIKHMKKALKLAEKGIHNVSPNPAVGALLVKDGKIIGEGFHRGPGYPHAEIEAIDNAKQSLKGTTLYCTLEPCSSMYEGKKQAPCTNRIIKEKISTVVISMVDPNPFVNGLGIKQLKEAGIVVISGILEDESRKLNEVFIKNKTKSLPFVHLKIAQTLDGKIATESNNSQWITDEDARKDVHKLRSLYDSVLIGSGTVLIDDPLLTIRYGIDKPICRIILDSKLKTPLHSNLLQNDQKNETYIFTGNNVDQDQITPYIQENVKIVKISINDENQIDLNELLRKLYHQKYVDQGSLR
jgi:diaminohydroxyphosphoribosylaminopyrimidine deaminase/5-amino-6-(5-phosphoribosylamino)uracil reductase